MTRSRATGANIVLLQAVAVSVHSAEVGLRLGISLIGGLAVPGGGLSGVQRHAVAEREHHAEGVLRGGIPLVGGLAISRDGLQVVLRRALAFVVHFADKILRASPCPANGRQSRSAYA
jgi:hypothetical protein